MPGIEWRTGLREDARTMARCAVDAFGAILSAIPWEWYVTLTYKADYVSARRGDTCFYRWLTQVRAGVLGWPFAPYAVYEDRPIPSAVLALGTPYYFKADEYQDRGTLHHHALLGGVGDLRRLTYKDQWERYGFARVLQYQPAMGAGFYVGKYLAKDQGRYTWSHNLEPYLKEACHEAIPRATQ